MAACLNKRSRQVLVTCEHAGTLVPKAYRTAFHGAGNVVRGHRNHDIGAADLAKAIGAACGCPVRLHPYARLLADVNRSPDSRMVFSDWTRPFPPSRKKALLELVYVPYRRRVEDAVKKRMKNGQGILHLSVHTFTPVLDGKKRIADVGLLYDPSCFLEKGFCRDWRKRLLAEHPQLRVHRNYPYRGVSDGLVAFFRKRFAESGYVGIELEVNQAWVSRRRDWDSLKRLLARTFFETLGRAKD